MVSLTLREVLRHLVKLEEACLGVAGLMHAFRVEADMPIESNPACSHPQAGGRVRRGDEQLAPGGVFRTPKGAGWPRFEEASDRLRRTHHGRNRGGLCESRLAA